MRYIIGAILLLVVLIIIGLIWRKKVYDEVDRLEGWKLDIMNRRVTEELSKVKNLNLSGETQEKFEGWRSRWDQVLTRDLPELEEDLFDAEEAADRYRVKQVKIVLADIEKKLESVEEDIKKMFGELESLLHSKENSRIEVEAIEPEVKELSKILIHNRHQFGKAVHVFENRIKGLQRELGHYEEMTERGDYMEANKLVQSIRGELAVLQDDISHFPERYRKTRSELPEQLNDLLNGIKEMDEEGYRVPGLEFTEKIHRYKESLEASVFQLEQGDQENVEELIGEVETHIQEMYQILEEEAIAHNFVEKYYSPYKQQLDELVDALMDMEKEIEELQYTYQIEYEDLEVYHGIEKWMSQLKSKFQRLNSRRLDGESSFAVLRGELKQAKQELDELYTKQQDFHTRVQALRKDEFDAKQKLSDLEQTLLDTHRRLQRSNIPGIPASVYDGMQQASELLDEVFLSLEKQPLDMVSVNKKLEEAMDFTQKLDQDAKELIDKAQLAERVIQYGNRYRSQYPVIAAKLLEAEKEFRTFEYDGALEQAAEAIREIDPEALSRLELNEQVPV